MKRFLSTCMLALALLGLATAAHADRTMTYERTVTGLDPDGWFIPGTTTLDITISCDSTLSGANVDPNAGINKVTGLSFDETLPAGWSYTGLTAGAANPTILPLTNTGTIQFSWITPPATPFTFTYQVSIPGNEPGGKTLTGVGSFRTNGNAIAFNTADDPINVKPTTVTIARASSGAGVAGSTNQFYVPGQEITVTISVTKDGPKSMTAFSVTDTLPANWTYTGIIAGPAAPTIAPLNNTGDVEFSWISVPAPPFEFSYTVAVPGNEGGLNKVLSAIGSYRFDGGAIPSNTVAVTLNPAPCVTFVTSGVGGDFYAAGTTKTINVHVEETCVANITAMSVDQTLPTGWTYASTVAGGAAPTINPLNNSGTVQFSWISVPAAPFDFQYVVNVPGGELGDKDIPGALSYRLGGGALAADPFTLTLSGADLTPCVIALTGDNPLTLEAGDAYVEPGFTATDDRDGDITGSVVVAGSVNSNVPGTYTVTYDTQDAANNACHAERTVNVVDTTPPAIALNGLSTVTVDCGGVYTEAGANATDFVDGTTAATATGTVDTTTIGSYTVNYDATDAAGNPATTVTRTVNVQDVTPPTITRTGLAVVTVECHTSYTDAGATANDTCEGDITNSIVSVNPVNVDVPGSYTVTYNVSDSTGNAAAQVTRTVNVTDTIDPVVTIIGASPFTVECGTAFVDPGANAQDSCDGALVATSNAGGQVNASQPGSYTVTYTATDAAGNAGTATRTVNVVDTTDPILTISGSPSVTIECGSSYTDANGTATDTCDTSVTVTNNAGTQVDTTTSGTYTVTITAVDNSGNTATVNRSVTVEDTTAPVISLTGSAAVTVECGTNYTDAGATATDSCDGSLSPVRSGTVDTSSPGDYTLTFNVSDSAGNAAVAVTRTVTVSDTIDPVVTLNGAASETVECSGSFTDAGATATDSCEGDLTGSIVVTGSVDTATPGSYTLTYTVSDTAGNSGSATRNVTVADTTNPSVALNGGPVTVECGTAYDELGATATDTCDSSVSVVTTGSVNTSTPGAYTITYSATDASGNSASASRVVSVSDTTIPVITLNGSASVSIPCGGPYTELGATASDSCDGNIAVTITGNIDVNNDTAPQTVTYTATDASGNQAAPVTRTVTVEICDQCPDTDANGIPDNIFGCLALDGQSIALDVDGGTCTRHVYGTTWFGDTPGSDISVSQQNPNDPNQTVTVSVGRDVIGAGQQAILVLSISCTLEDLLGDTAFNLGTTPDGEVAGNAWFDVSIVVSDDGGATYHKLDNAALATNPVTISINGLNPTPGATVEFQSYDTYIAPDGDTGNATIQSILGDSWGSDGLDCSYADGTLTCEVTHLSVFGAFESVEAGPAIEVTPSAAFDLVVGTARINLDTLTATVTVKNTGGGTLTGAATVNGATFGLVGDATFSLAAGASDTITVKFTPTTIGNFTGTLTITNNAGAPVAITLKGTGTRFQKRFEVFGIACSGNGPASGSTTGDLAVIALVLGGLYLSNRTFRRAKQS